MISHASYLEILNRTPSFSRVQKGTAVHCLLLLKPHQTAHLIELHYAALSELSMKHKEELGILNLALGYLLSRLS